MARAMFGAGGLFKGGVMFRILSRMDRFYLKVDDINTSDSQALDAEPFRPHQGSEMTMAYFEVPVEILDDPEGLAFWVDKAWEAARRNFARKAPRNRISHGRS